MATPFDIRTTLGLTESCTAERLREEGYNELPSSRQRSVLAIALEVVREPMFLLLVVCGLLYMVMGEPTDALMLLGFVFVVMGITIFQERRTERALEALKDLSSPRALVVRDGRQKRIAGREVVRGDIVLVAEGDRVPADATLLQGINLTVDESLLTGESVPVRKSPATNAQPMQRTGRRRSAVPLFRHIGDCRPRHRRSPEDRDANGAREDRQGDSRHRAGTDAVAD